MSRKILIQILGDATGAVAAFGKTEAAAVGLNAQAEKSAIVGKALLGGLALGIGAIGASVVKSGMAFREAMNEFKGVSEASDADMAKVQKRALELGRDLTLPGTSATTAARGMVELAKSGLSVAESLDAAYAVSLLATAANIDTAQAAEIASNALNTWGLKGKDALFVVDQLAMTANKSSASITDASHAYAQAAGVFNAFQSPVTGAKNALREMSIELAILHNNGIKGEMAGTAIKMMLIKMAAPTAKAKDMMRALMTESSSYNDVLTVQLSKTKTYTGSVKGLLSSIDNMTQKERRAAIAALEHSGAIKAGGDIAYDATGKMRPMTEIFGLLKKGLKGLREEEQHYFLGKVYGSDAIKASFALMKSEGKAHDDLQIAFSRTGAAQAIAAAKTQGLTGAWMALKTTVNSAMVEAFLRVEPVLTKIVMTIATNVLPVFDAFKEAAGNLFDKMKPALEYIEKNWDRFSIAFAAAGAVLILPVVAAIGSALMALAVAAAPILLVAAAVGALAFAFITAYKKSEDFRRIVDAVVTAVKRAVRGLVDAVKMALDGDFGRAWDKAFQTVKDFASDIKKAFDGVKWGELWDKVFEAGRNLVSKIPPMVSKWVEEVKAWMKTVQWGSVWDTLFELGRTALHAIATMMGKIKDAVIQAFYDVDWSDFGIKIVEWLKKVFGKAFDEVGPWLKSQGKKLLSWLNPFDNDNEFIKMAEQAAKQFTMSYRDQLVIGGASWSKAILGHKNAIVVAVAELGRSTRPDDSTIAATTRTYVSAGVAWAQGMVRGLSVPSALSGATSAGTRMGEAARNGIGSGYGAGQAWAVSAADGMIAGLRAKVGSVQVVAASFTGSVAGAGMKGQESNSPSKWWERIGGWATEGMAIGIEKGTPRATKAAHKSAKDVTYGFIDGVKEMASRVAAAAAEIGEKFQAAIGGAMGGYNAGKSLRSAQRGVVDAQRDLTAAQAKSASLPGRIAAAEVRLANARANGAEITAEEQSAIEDATAALEEARKGYTAGTLSAAKYQIAEDKLRKVTEAATESSSEAASIERELLDLRSEAISNASDLERAELAVSEAQDQLAEATIAAYEAQKDLNALGDDAIDTWAKYALAAGVAADQVERMAAAMRAAGSAAGTFGGGVGGGLPIVPDSVWNTVNKNVPGGDIVDYWKNLYGGSVVGYASGGFVTARPGGQMARIGEGGQDEIVSPVPMLRQIVRSESGGGVTINVQGNVMDGRDLVDIVLRGLRDAGMVRSDGLVAAGRR